MWNLRQLGIQVRTNVNAPQAMTKLSTDGEPRPYRADDDFNGATFTDRILTAYQSKYDMLLDPEELRNTYLATLPDMPFEQSAVEQAAKQFLDSLIRSTLWTGVRDANGDAAADICDGWGTLIAALIVAGDLDPVVTGAITSANAVDKVEAVAESVPDWMREMGFRILCSYGTLDKYKKHYRTLNGFGFNKSETGQYKLDAIDAILQPTSILGTSQRLVATVDNNLVFGTDTERISMYPTPYLNLMKNRLLFPAGCEIQDLDAIVVNDQQ